MSEWKEVKLGTLCTKVCSGGTPKSGVSDYYGGGIPWLNTKEVNFNRIYSTENTISQNGLDNSSAKWIDANSIIVAMYGATAGKVAITKIPITTNQACCNLTINNELADYNYIYYTLKKDFTILASLANGGAQQNLNTQIIKDYSIRIPDLPTQQRIASILSSLDAKIENNNKINAKLEEIAQNLFKEWFVDFGPFKDGKFVESELGLIPEGWRVGTLGEICEYSRRKISTKSLTCSNYFSTENMLQNKAGATIASSIPDVETVTGCMDYDVLVSNIRPYFKKILRVTGVSGCSADVLCFHPKASKFYSFLFCSIYDDKFFTYVMSGAKGTKMPRGDKNQIMKYPIILPDDSILGKFSYIIEPLFERINTLKEENQRLSTLRDTLLPKLMSGEIEV